MFIDLDAVFRVTLAVLILLGAGGFLLAVTAHQRLDAVELELEPVIVAAPAEAIERLWCLEPDTLVFTSCLRAGCVCSGTRP